jgi:hypothetical protein
MKKYIISIFVTKLKKFDRKTNVLEAYLIANIAIYLKNKKMNT